jgi:hypothetical protein
LAKAAADAAASAVLAEARKALVASGGSDLKNSAAADSAATNAATAAKAAADALKAAQNALAAAEAKSKTDQHSLKDYCDENHTKKMCKDEVDSAFSKGLCGVPPSCQGDAIQCAIAEMQFQAHCDMVGNSEALKLIGETAVAGGNLPADHPGNDANVIKTNFSLSGMIDQTDALGGGCPSDVTVSVAGAVVTIPWSRMCGALNLAGSIAVAGCLLAAAMIVFRS